MKHNGTFIEAVHAYQRSFAHNIVQELIEFVQVENNVYKTENIQANADHVLSMLERRGFETQVLASHDGRPLILAHLTSNPDAPTYLLYSHYDGVPVDLNAWHSDPYVPVLRATGPSQENHQWQTVDIADADLFNAPWRLYGRSVADSKNAIVELLAAIDFLRFTERPLSVNIKLLLDGAEEIESPGLADTMLAHQEKLAADIAISMSGETHQSGLPTVMLGLRGILVCEITTYTATSALHSGHFGNFMPNSGNDLVKLLSTLKSSDGMVQIDGFYDEVLALSPYEMEAIAAIPRIESEIINRYGITRQEIADKSIQQLINMPTLNIRGIRSGFVGEEARNIIPEVAVAELDIRLVKDMQVETTFGKLVDHVRAQGWYVTDEVPDLETLRQHSYVARIRLKAGFPATRTELANPVVEDILRKVRKGVTEKIVIMPTEGGSLPLYLFEKIGIPYIGIPTSNYDCNQHTADENLDLSYLFRAISMYAALLS